MVEFLLIDPIALCKKTCYFLFNDVKDENYLIGFKFLVLIISFVQVSFFLVATVKTAALFSR